MFLLSFLLPRDVFMGGGVASTAYTLAPTPSSPQSRAARGGDEGPAHAARPLKGEGSVLKRLLSSLSFERVWRAPTSSEGVAHRL